MSKSIVVDRVKIIAEMARQNLTGAALLSRCAKGSPYGVPPQATWPQLWA